jgi:hypothetical protein
MFFVGVVFITQAAFETSAATGNLAGIEGSFLELGHFHGDGGHFLQVRIAADGFAAVSVIGEQSGFIADTDLPHFNAEVEVASENADEFAEVDAVFGKVIQDQFFTTEDQFDIHQLHLQSTFPQLFCAASEQVTFASCVFFASTTVLVGHRSQHTATADSTVPEPGGGLSICGAEHDPPFDTSFGAHNDLVPAEQSLVTTRFKVSQQSSIAVANDVARCFRAKLLGFPQ